MVTDAFNAAVDEAFESELAYITAKLRENRSLAYTLSGLMKNESLTALLDGRMRQVAALSQDKRKCTPVVKLRAHSKRFLQLASQPTVPLQILRTLLPNTFTGPPTRPLPKK